VLDLTHLTISDFAQDILNQMPLKFVTHNPHTEAAYAAVRVDSAEEADVTLVVDIPQDNILDTDDFTVDHYGLLHVAFIDPKLKERLPRNLDWDYTELGSTFSSYVTAQLYLRSMLVDPAWVGRVYRKDRSCQYVPAVTDIFVMGQQLDDTPLSPWEAVLCGYGHDHEMALTD
jgi:hypothetical protein